MQSLGLSYSAILLERTILICPSNRSEHDSNNSAEIQIQINIQNASINQSFMLKQN